MNKKRKMDKKAQGLSIQTVILLILGVIVLVILILGFTVGWDRIKNWIAPSNNVKDVSDACRIACATDQEYAFCSEIRTLKAKDLAGGKVDTTCSELATNPEYSKYGIDDCPGLCGVEALKICEELGGTLTPKETGCGDLKEISSSDTDEVNVCCK